MEIRVLKYFLKLCETESITAAAQALSITQPALSRQLVSLEEAVCTREEGRYADRCGILSLQARHRDHQSGR